MALLSWASAVGTERDEAATLCFAGGPERRDFGAGVEGESSVPGGCVDRRAFDGGVDSMSVVGGFVEWRDFDLEERVAVAGGFVERRGFDGGAEGRASAAGLGAGRLLLERPGGREERPAVWTLGSSGDAWVGGTLEVWRGAAGGSEAALGLEAAIGEEPVRLVV